MTAYAEHKSLLTGGRSGPQSSCSARAIRTYGLQIGDGCFAAVSILSKTRTHSRIIVMPFGKPGIWHTEVGPLNRVIHVWAYDSFEERTRVRAESQKLEGWPPNIREFVTEQQSEIFLPAPFSECSLLHSAPPRSYCSWPSLLPEREAARPNQTTGRNSKSQWLRFPSQSLGPTCRDPTLPYPRTPLSRSGRPRTRRSLSETHPIPHIASRLLSFWLLC
jgi:hypothetical protein